MNFNTIKYCPSTLAEGYESYSPTGLKNLFNGKKVSHILPFGALKLNEDVAEQFRQNSKIISISGAQFKQSLLLEKNKLRLTNEGEVGHYILKPIPPGMPFQKTNELPANEHLTMQIAKQVYGIETAQCGLVFFNNGEPAYITKRFDYTQEGNKIAQEDFAAVSGFSKEKDGAQYRTAGSYEDIAITMKKHIAAYPIEIEKFYTRVLFNFLFNNADAHLKNFSVQQTTNGDYVLSPAYDLINTFVHIPSERLFALSGGLFTNNYTTESFKQLGFCGYDDFFEFGIRIGIAEKRVIKLLDVYCTAHDQVIELTKHSFLTRAVKVIYKAQYQKHLAMLNTSHMRKSRTKN